MNTLYYSEKCKHCERLLSSCNMNGYKLVNIDNTGAPPMIKVVPTIVDNTNNAKVYEGTAAFQFANQNQTIEPYSFHCSNNTNKGFSFIDTPSPIYTEQTNYSIIKET